MVIRSQTSMWVVPSCRAIWIPAFTKHDIKMTGQVQMRSLYFHPSFVDENIDRVRVVTVSALLRELILEAFVHGMLNKDNAIQQRLGLVMLDQVKETPVAPLEIRFPEDQRARRVAMKASTQREWSDSKTTLVQGSGASLRTIERLFRSETGMTLGHWLEQLKVKHALELLASGESVTSTSLRIGYESTSAFIEMFRRVTGVTPGRYFQVGESK